MTPGDSPSSAVGYEWDGDAITEAQPPAAEALPLPEIVSATPADLAAPTDSIEPAHDLELVGQRLHGFDVLEEIGAGASGRVYRAAHHYLGYVCAVKVLSETSYGAGQERFLREARALYRIRHPNVVTLYDYGRTAQGQSFLAMEWVDGTTLQALIAAGSMSLRLSAELILQITEGLSAAHQLGLLHRDLKPSNVMVMREGERRIVKIVDFGLVGADPFDDSAAPLTRPGNLLGTPLYMSPEQILGHAPAPPADLYALGVILYELLSGHPPFTAPEIPALLGMHVKELPAPLAPAFGLEVLASRLLAKRAEDRPTLEEARASIDESLRLAEQAERQARQWTIGDTLAEKTPGPLPPAELPRQGDVAVAFDDTVIKPLAAPRPRSSPERRVVRRVSDEPRRPRVWRCLWALGIGAILGLLVLAFERWG